MGAYKNLCAMLETTKGKRNELRAEIRGQPPDLILAVVRYRTFDGKRDKIGNTLATAPFRPGHEDWAAADVARRLTLDGDLPRGMKD
jgi:hypothetical protein